MNENSGSKYVELSSVLQSIARQYSEHHAIIPAWLTLGDVVEETKYMRCPCCNNVYCLQSYNAEGKLEAEWIDTGDKWEEYAEQFKCSNCGHKDYFGNYCSNCGASMRLRSSGDTK